VQDRKEKKEWAFLYERYGAAGRSDCGVKINPPPRAGKKLVEALGKGAQFSGSAPILPHVTLFLLPTFVTASLQELLLEEDRLPSYRECLA
jgi:hypothetical protein